MWMVQMFLYETANHFAKARNKIVQIHQTSTRNVVVLVSTRVWSLRCWLLCCYHLFEVDALHFYFLNVKMWKLQHGNSMRVLRETFLLLFTGFHSIFNEKIPQQWLHTVHGQMLKESTSLHLVLWTLDCFPWKSGHCKNLLNSVLWTLTVTRTY